MRRVAALAAALAFAPSPAVAAPAAAAPGASAPDAAALAALLDPSRPDRLLGLQVSVVVGDATHDYAFGLARPAGSGAGARPMTADTLMRVASASKPVAAVAALRLARRGLLDLDADIGATLGRRLRNPAHPDVPITPRMLLAHTSSIVDGIDYRVPLGARLADALTPAAFSARRPGARFEYSNLGWAVLGTLLERAGGERFDRLMAREVLVPAGVEGGFDVAAIEASRLAPTYRRGPEGATRWPADAPWIAQFDDPTTPAAWSAPGADPALADYRLGDNGALFAPQGGLRTNARSLARLWRALLDPRSPLLDPADRAALLGVQWRYRPEARNGDTAGGLYLSWGLGVQRFTGAHDRGRRLLDSPVRALDGRPMVGHLAEAYGMFGGAWFTPDGRFGVVYLINGVAQPPAGAPGARSALYRWDEAIMDWATRDAWGWR